MIREQVLEYFEGDELATDVFLSKYSCPAAPKNV